MPRAAVRVILMLVVLLAGGAVAWCQSGDWPAEMTLGGFKITDIRGSGSSATGQLQMSFLSNPRVNLTRSPSGSYSGNLGINVRPSGCELQGSFGLDGSGMRGRGTLKTPIRPVNDASLTVESSGQISGSGRMDLGQISMPVKISISSSSLSVTGSTQVKAQADTPLATYSFGGELKLDCSNSKPSLTARGSVTRTGKLSNQTSTTSVSGIDVNPSDGTGKVNVDGVNVMFDFLKR